MARLEPRGLGALYPSPPWRDQGPPRPATGRLARLRRGARPWDGRNRRGGLAIATPGRHTLGRRLHHPRPSGPRPEAGSARRRGHRRRGRRGLLHPLYGRGGRPRTGRGGGDLRRWGPSPGRRRPAPLNGRIRRRLRGLLRLIIARQRPCGGGTVPGRRAGHDRPMGVFCRQQPHRGRP